jgi:hypothetical protein
MAQQIQATPGAPLVLLAPPVASPISTLQQYYNLNNQQDQYNNLMGEFAPGNPRRQPAGLRQLNTNDPDHCSLRFLYWIEDASNPAGPGIIQMIHSKHRYSPGLGYAPTPRNDNNYRFVGNIVGTQLLTTVEFPNAAFQLLNLGTFYHVPLGPGTVSYPQIECYTKRPSCGILQQHGRGNGTYTDRKPHHFGLHFFQVAWCRVKPGSLLVPVLPTQAMQHCASNY